MEQLTAINGRKIPKLWYSEGENLSITISTNCTIAAITAIKTIGLRKSKLTSGKPNQAKAPSPRR